MIVSTYMTLDGRVDEPRDWALPYDDDGAANYHNDLLMNSDGLLLGRKTYEMFAALFPARSGELPYVDKINSMAKYVASTTLKDLGWENSHLIEGDSGQAQGTARSGPDHVWRPRPHAQPVGTRPHRRVSNPASTSPAREGRSFLKDGMERIDLDLVDTTVIPSGVAILTYQSKR